MQKKVVLSLAQTISLPATLLIGPRVCDLTALPPAHVTFLTYSLYTSSPFRSRVYAIHTPSLDTCSAGAWRGQMCPVHTYAMRPRLKAAFGLTLRFACSRPQHSTRLHSIAEVGPSSCLTALEPTARNCDPAALMMAFWSSSTCSGCLASISSCMLGGRVLDGSFRLMQQNRRRLS